MTAYRVILKSTTATVLTPYTFDQCVESCRARFGGEFERLRPESGRTAGALQAECEKLRKDAERYRCIRKGNQWIVAATQTGFHVDGEELDGVIDAELGSET